MEFDLEGVSHKEVVNSNGINYSDFRKKLKPNFEKVWRDIFLGYLALIVLAGFSVVAQEMLVKNTWQIFIYMPFMALFMGYVIAYLQLFVHEAAHFNIHPDKKKNDTLANALLCTMVGINIEPYRQTHWDHHKYLGTVNDSENSYFNALTVPFVIQTLTGIHAIRVILNRHKRIENANIKKNKNLSEKDKKSLVRGILLNLLIIIASLVFGQYILALSWVLGLGIFFPFFATLRQLLEHRGELAKASLNYSVVDHGSVIRTFKATFFSVSFGGAGFINHMLHHWDPTLSYTCLPSVKKFLLETDKYAPYIRKSTTTYTSTFFKLLKAN